MVFYAQWGIVGLWVGPTVAIIFNFIFYYLIIMKLDWQKICDDVKERSKRDNEVRNKLNKQ